jgi:small subunit ribosomal protein S2
VKLIVSKMADAVIEANQGEAVYTEEVEVGEEPSMEEVAE